MLVRLRWFGAGVATGALGAVYGLYRLRQTRQRYARPEQVIDTIGGGVQVAASTARSVWDEARLAMTEVEQELRERHPAPPGLRAVER